MARIIYGVCGEGMGHAVRSRPIIDHLKKSHDVRIFASGVAYSYLSGIFKGVKRIDGLHIKYRKNSVAELKTLFYNLLNAPKIIISFLAIREEIARFRPDVVISDLDIATSYAALSKAIPLISIDNQHASGKIRIAFPPRYWPFYLELKLIDRIIIPTARRYFVTSFFYAEPKYRKVSVIHPLLRKKILGLKPRIGDFIMVYQTSDSNDKLIKELKKTGYKFVVYGFNMEKKDKNIIFRRFNEKIFLKELAGCKALITNGGFTLISEALYLKKPVLSIPVRRHFEQILNAVYVEKMGYGVFSKKADAQEITYLMDNLGAYKKNLQNYSTDGPKHTLDMIDDAIKSFI